MLTQWKTKNSTMFPLGSAALPGPTFVKLMEFCCCMMLLLRAASSTSEHGWIRFRYLQWCWTNVEQMTKSKMFGSILQPPPLFLLRNQQRRKSPCVLLETRWTSESSFYWEAVWAVCTGKSWPRCVSFSLHQVGKYLYRCPATKVSE